MLKGERSESAVFHQVSVRMSLAGADAPAAAPGKISRQSPSDGGRCCFSNASFVCCCCVCLCWSQNRSDSFSCVPLRWSSLRTGYSTSPSALFSSRLSSSCPAQASESSPWPRYVIAYNIMRESRRCADMRSEERRGQAESETTTPVQRDNRASPGRGMSWRGSPRGAEAEGGRKKEESEAQLCGCHQAMLHVMLGFVAWQSTHPTQICQARHLSRRRFYHMI